MSTIELHPSVGIIAEVPVTVTVPDVLDLEKIRTLRTKKGLSMEDAAKAAGLAGRQSWYEIESGRKANVTIETLTNIAGALGVKPKDLLKE